ncbi:MAG: hypothetical protein RR320_01160 [Oscillospiraceae bacterium]
MPVGMPSQLPNGATRMLICVDQLSYGEAVGRIYNAYLAEPQFTGIVQLIQKMDWVFDTLSFPQATFSARRFGAKNKLGPSPGSREAIESMEDTCSITAQGQKATFIVEVQFRQNATWQGTVSWTEGRQTQRFRSTLELIKLMGDALADEQDDDGLADWDEKRPVRASTQE